MNAKNVTPTELTEEVILKLLDGSTKTPPVQLITYTVPGSTDIITVNRSQIKDHIEAWKQLKFVTLKIKRELDKDIVLNYQKSMMLDARKQQIEYQDRTEYTLDGALHNDNGPAIVHKNGDEFWYQYGQLHRVGGPAMKFQNGDE